MTTEKKSILKRVWLKISVVVIFISALVALCSDSINIFSFFSKKPDSHSITQQDTVKSNKTEQNASSTITSDTIKSNEIRNINLMNGDYVEGDKTVTN